MRRAAILACLAVIAPLSVSLSAAVAAEGSYPLNVPVDQSRRVPFAGQAASVISGNSELIHAYIVSPSDVRVVGRKLGLTNLVVLDGAGRTLFDRQINVSAGDGSVVTIYRGGAATSYACSPWCAQAVGAANVPNRPILNPPVEFEAAPAAPVQVKP